MAVDATQREVERGCPTVEDPSGNQAVDIGHIGEVEEEVAVADKPATERTVVSDPGWDAFGGEDCGVARDRISDDLHHTGETGQRTFFRWGRAVCAGR